jgi:hypothetical protein
MMECTGNLLFAEARPVIAFDQQRDAAAVIDVAGPSHRTVKCVEFLVEQSILVQRSDRLRSARDRYKFGRS